jgi:molecular chaperone DnaK (HSP70)
VTGAAGEFVRSPKTLLGSQHGISVGGVTRKPRDLAADIFRFIRKDAIERAFEGQDFDQAVVSIPVTMRGDARRELRQAALMAGIRIEQFVHEPLAALYGHLRGGGASMNDIANLENQLLLVFDWGGGTLDLTLCRVKHGVLVQIANLGDSTVGGDQFDLRIERLVRSRHEAMFPNLDWNKFQPSGKARLIEACEDAKIALSARQSTTVFVADVLVFDSDAAHIEVTITRDDIYEVTRDLIRRGLQSIEELLARADASVQDIEFCLVLQSLGQCLLNERVL